MRRLFGGGNVQFKQQEWSSAEFVPPFNFSVTIYKELARKQLCELFSPSTAPGFVGYCNIDMKNMSSSCPGVIPFHDPCSAILWLVRRIRCPF